jgi:hypothetical protein
MALFLQVVVTYRLVPSRWLAIWWKIGPNLIQVLCKFLIVNNKYLAFPLNSI